MSEIPPPPSYPPPPPSYPPPGPAPVTQAVLVASLGPEGHRSSPGRVVAIALTGVLLIGALAVGVPLAMGSDPVGPAVATDLAEVQEYDDLAADHEPGDLDYPQHPAVGGPHAPVWLECGVYADPVREENAVHDLEHGAVWISYAGDLDTDDVETLAGLLPQNGIMAPYPELPSPVVVTVWGRQLALTGADDPRLPLFIDTYGGGETAPEPFASCAGGVTDPGDDVSGDDTDDGVPV